jgi:hypothetical protein
LLQPPDVASARCCISNMRLESVSLHSVVLQAGRFLHNPPTQRGANCSSASSPVTIRTSYAFWQGVHGEHGGASCNDCIHLLDRQSLPQLLSEHYLLALPSDTQHGVIQVMMAWVVPGLSDQLAARLIQPLLKLG